MLQVKDSRGRVVREGAPRVRREVVPPGVAKMVAEMLTATSSTETGAGGNTGVEAAMQGFRVAGKTATAQKVDPATGKYSMDQLHRRCSSGFVPAEQARAWWWRWSSDDPMIGHYGGDLAGPVFRRVAEASLRYLGVPAAGREASAGCRTVKASLTSPIPSLTPRCASPPQEAGSLARDRPRRRSAPSQKPMQREACRTRAGYGRARRRFRAISGAGLVPDHRRIGGRLVRQVPPAPGAPVPVRGSSVRLVFEPSRHEGTSVDLFAAARPWRRRPELDADLEELAREIRGETAISGDPSTHVRGVQHDSRHVEPGDLFVVRKGASHDGRLFLDSAVQKGAVAILAATGLELPPGPLPVLRVPDIADGLGVRRYPRRLRAPRAFSLDIVGVTGTNGKTTTTHLVRAAIDGALRQSSF